MKYNYLKKLFVGSLFLASTNVVFGQATVTHPTAVSVAGGYSQNFDNMGTTYPAGWYGWNVEESAPGGSVNPRIKEPRVNINTILNGTAASTGNNVYNFAGKIGFKSGNSSDNTIMVALNTAGVTQRVRVKFDAMVIRNVYNGTTLNLVTSLVLQYRIGTSGEFTNVNNTVRNGTTAQTSGTNGQSLQNFTFILPEECSNVPVLQLRWILRYISGDNNPASSNDRPSFAIDNFVVDTAPSPAPFTGYTISTKNITAQNGVSYATKVVSGVTRVEPLTTYRASLADDKGAGTGYFSLHKDPATGVWNFLDPDGHIFYMMGVNVVLKGGGVDPVNQLTSVYANTIGNFSDETINNKIPWTSRLNFALNYRGVDTRTRTLYDNSIIPVFDAAFLTYCRNRAAAEITTAEITNKFLVGYFSDNEVPLANAFTGPSLIEKWLDVSFYGGQAAADADPNYIAAVNWMKSRHGGNLVAPNNADKQEWPGVVAAKYYEVCNTAIKERDPNHLFLGSRLHQDLQNPFLFQAAALHCDVVSVNNYNVWTEAELNARYDVWAANSNKPFLIGEFYAQAADAGLPNSLGAGFRVFTQQDRADYFENFTLTTLKNKSSVGYQYFEYKDNPLDPLDPTKGDNKGLLDSEYRWWEPMRQSFTEIGQDVYRLREFLIDQTLPVNLQDFKVVKDVNKVDVSWVTTSEQNNDYFEIQHATNPNNFTTIAKVKGNGTTNAVNAYSFKHINPVIGTNYYKLVQYDYDGKFTEKGIKSVNFSLNSTNNAALMVYPNPSTDIINISLSEFEGNQTSLMVTDMLGRVVYQEQIDVQGNFIKPLSLKNKFGQGTYLIKASAQGLTKSAKIQIQ
jgi:hypothetical protein